MTIKKTSPISLKEQSKTEKSQTTLEKAHEFSEDWKKQMHLKNEAILKAIEELIDKSLNGHQNQE